MTFKRERKEMKPSVRIQLWLHFVHNKEKETWHDIKSKLDY